MRRLPHFLPRFLSVPALLSVAVLAGSLLLGAAPAHAVSDTALAKAFATGFVTGFEKSTSVVLPNDEATCVGTRFVPKVKVTDFAKIKTIDDLTPVQRQALVDSLALCLSPKTYTLVLDKKLTTLKPAQRTCFEAAVLKIGVPKLLALDFEDFLKKPQTATTAQVNKLAKSCIK